MKFEIMLSILFELLSRKSVTAAYLSEKYEISKRTVYRYINSLELAGVPLYSTRGTGGGFSVIDTYRLSSTFMTVKEFNEAINALSTITANVPNKELENVITKLKATIKNEYSGFDVRCGNLVIDAGPWGDTVGYKSKLHVIEKAIQDYNLLSITYHDRNGTVTERLIEPHIIVFKQGLWYVYAYCRLRNDFRFFKIGRIEKANISGEKFTRRDIKQNELPLDFWHNIVESTLITMEIDKKVLSDVEEWIGTENVQKENEKYIARASLPFDNGLVSKIISFGDGIKVLSPAVLIAEIKKSVNDIKNIYD